METELSKVSPVLPWSEVEKLTPQQLSAYGRRLSKFTSRDNRLTVLRSQEIVPYSLIKESKDLAREINKRVDKENRRRLKLYGDKIQLQDKINIKELPTSKQWAKRRVENLRRRSKHSESYYLKVQRKNIQTQLRALGLDKEANRIGNLRADKLSWLVNNKDFNIWDLLNTYYIPNETSFEETLSEKASRQMVDETYNNAIGDYIERAVKLVVLKKLK